MRITDITALRRSDCPVCVNGWACEEHPEKPWPHDECAGPGVPCRVEGCAESKMCPWCGAIRRDEPLPTGVLCAEPDCPSHGIVLDLET